MTSWIQVSWRTNGDIGQFCGRIGVVGAGLAGLTLSYILRQAGHQVIFIMKMAMMVTIRMMTSGDLDRSK